MFMGQAIQEECWSYVGNSVASDWFSENVMLADKVSEV
jgi:hypothetical protein